MSWYRPEIELEDCVCDALKAMGISHFRQERLGGGCIPDVLAVFEAPIWAVIVFELKAGVASYDALEQLRRYKARIEWLYPSCPAVIGVPMAPKIADIDWPDWCEPTQVWADEHTYYDVERIVQDVGEIAWGTLD